MSRPSFARTTFRYCRASKAAMRRAHELAAVAPASAWRHDAEYAAHNAQAKRLWHNLPPAVRAAFKEGE